MELHKRKQEFRDAIIATSNYYQVSPTIVEKDYFVTLILKKLKEKIPGILFKGGTGLSKCFKVIYRFSEDIDLTLDTSHFTQGNKRKANKSVLAVCDEMGFMVQNREIVEKRSHGNYNCYNIEYPASFEEYSVKPFIKVEMTFIQKAYPDTVKPVCSMIGEYLSSIGKKELLPSFELDAYEMKVQSLERTFVDKVFAICDYYLRGEVIRQSRHIYDICKLMDVIDWSNQDTLIQEVRQDRVKNKTCLSAQPEIDISKILYEIIETEYFKRDFTEVTSSLLNEKMDYETAVASIKIIAERSLFDVN